MLTKHTVLLGSAFDVSFRGNDSLLGSGSFWRLSFWRNRVTFSSGILPFKSSALPTEVAVPLDVVLLVVVAVLLVVVVVVVATDGTGNSDMINARARSRW